LERYLKNLKEKEFVLTSHRLAHPPYLFENQPEKVGHPQSVQCVCGDSPADKGYEPREGVLRCQLVVDDE